MLPTIDPETGKIEFPDIPAINLTDNQYSPNVNTITGKILFPALKQDNTDIYVHNFCQALDEINTQRANRPFIISAIGTNTNLERDDLEVELYDYHYSHKLIKQLVENKNYIPTQIASRRDEYTYGDTTFIHLNNPKENNQRFLYENNFQISFLLSKAGNISYPVVD